MRTDSSTTRCARSTTCGRACASSTASRTVPGKTARAAEPEKNAAWGWYGWGELPRPLFEPVVSLLASLYPLTTVFLAYLILHERLSSTQAAGVLVALAGIVLVVVG